MKTERRLKQLGIELTPATSPMANYVNAVRVGSLVFFAGKGPGLPGHKLPVGKVGREFTKEQGYESPIQETIEDTHRNYNTNL